jgi:hypothetical protein
MQRRIGVLGAVVLSFALLAVPAAQARQRETIHPGKYRGIVFAKTRVARTTSNLTYHGGPVEHTNTVYSFYWYPSGTTLLTTTYANTIDQFFTDVAQDSGLTSNVYYAGTQYYDGTGNLRYSSSFAGRIVDTDAFPASGCRDSVTPGSCLTDAQIQSELSSYVTSHSLPTGGTTEYFVFTPKGVGSCFSGSTECAFSYYCAYHSNIGTGSNEILYANMPYADTDPSACDQGEHPNGGDADATINVTSHEHNETITDPLGTAWYDRQGNEDGDKCAWNFGAVAGPAGAEYNQTINGHHYFLQQEWSNHSSGCVLTGI